ncbi:DUF3955 domain-containing protein [Vibrio mytili]|uniref:DUF3955 domain-containing protein n=1 Tax=Vibrio mytili TaxID=50718 RepID=A0A0C3HTP1_9VIBR|nr:DUF3955 domain-containing protein [Vibrio mytili]KIN11556.1 hypothetical protein SU60_07075 [Vibrio mytili]
MRLLKAYKVSVVLCIAGIVSLVAYNTVGSHVDENGILVEPFALIPIFWLLELLAGVAFVVTYLKRNKASK